MTQVLSSTNINTASSPSAAVVTCVEAGSLESQTIRMIQSLRRWGGAMANLPVVAVTPRFGPGISRNTRKSYDRLGVTHVRSKAISPYAWYNFLNKPAALVAAERVVQVDSMIWLDADILIVREPADLLLQNGEDFTACAREKNIGTTGPDNAYHEYWVQLCAALGMTVEDLPWVTECHTHEKIRAYFNGGVLSYRPSSGYAAAYLDACNRLMDARFGIPRDTFFYHEQAAAGLVMAKLKLPWRPLSDSHNFHFGSKTLHEVDFQRFAQACVLHYHRFMRPENWDKFLALLSKDYPEVQQWLKPLGALYDNLSPPRWVLNKLVRARRQKLSARYLASCRVIK